MEERENGSIELETLENVNSSSLGGEMVVGANSSPSEDHSIDVKAQDLKSHIHEKTDTEKRTGMYVEARGLSYYVTRKVKKEGKKVEEKLYLLNDMSFTMKPGRMVLLMGAPSSGKSTLIKVLANRLGKGAVEGKLLFNNHAPHSDLHQKDVIYVPQEDRHIALLTVRETLEFSARCNMGSSASEEEIQERVDMILDQIGISHTVNTIVGNEFFRGISGGQKRRVTVASEFTKCPTMMLLDEPSTGLDSHTSYSVVSKIKTMTQELKTSTMISLLQPSPELIGLFDDIMILAEDGKIAYFGPFSDMLPYFNTISIAPFVGQPIAEFIQEVAFEPNKFLIDGTAKMSSSLDEVQVEKIDLYNKFKQSKYHDNIVQDLDRLIPENLKLKDISTSNTYEVNSVWYETKLCLQRHWKVMKIMKLQYMIRFCQAIFMGFVIGTLYYQQPETQAGARNRFGLLYFSMVLHIWSAFGSIEEFYTLRGIFYEQSANKFYGTFPFFLSMTLTKIPVSFIEALLFSVMTYWLAGLRATADSFIVFVLAMMFTNTVSSGLFQMSSAFIESIVISSLINPAISVICMIMSGFILPKPNFGGWWIWFYWITPMKYILEMVASNEMYNRDFHCAESEMIPPKDYPNFNLTYPDGYNGVQICPGSNGNSFLEYYGMPENSYFRWIDVAIVLAYICGIWFVLYMGLRYIRFEVKKPAKVIKPKKNKEKKQKVRESKHKLDGCFMTFKDLNYTVDSVKKNPSTGKDEKVKLQLLKDINGFVTPGMMALMGASGAGKSTLLDIFSKRKNTGTITGDIKINNHSIHSIHLTRFTGYVEQVDILPANLTVREAIEFNANCRLPSHFTDEEKKRMIDDILKVLNLAKIQNVKIGPNPTMGISLANRKKLSIGIELSADPHLLFLDEPTSSLDSGDALKVMNCVKRIAESGKTIVCTIHQPSAEIFDFFDQLLLLDKGETIYFGETGEDSQKVINYFTSQGYEYTPGRNPADFILEVTEKHLSNSKFQPPIQFYKSSSINQETVDKLNNDYTAIVPAQKTLPNYHSKYSSTFSTQLRWVIKRSWLNHVRRPQTIILRFLRAFIPALIIGTMFIRLKNDQPGARNKLSMIFLSFLFLGMASVGKIPFVVEDRGVYYRDRSSKSYPSIVYLIASFVTDLPMMLLTSFSFWIPFFFLTGLDPGHGGWKFFFSLGVYCLVCICYDSLSLLFASVMPTTPTATLLNSMALNFIGLFGGFMIEYPSIKKSWVFMYHLVFTKYGFETLGTTALKGQTFDCPDGVGAYAIPVTNNQTLLYCPIQNGEYMMNIYGFNPDRQFINLIILAAYIIGYQALCYLAITFIRHQKR